MAKSIADLKDGIQEKVGVHDIQIVKQISADHYIVGDKNDHIVLISEQNLQSGSAYRLIKPSFSEMKLRKNPKFATVKMENKIKTKPLSKKDEEVLCENIVIDKKNSCNKIENDFALVNSLGVGAICQEIKLMVVKKSKVISGKFGNYRILGCKDIKNQKNSVNLYRNLIDMVEVGKIYIFTKLKVANLKKEEDEFNRIATTNSSSIIEASKADEKEFEEKNVRIGDFIAKGTIIGISKLNIYQSCKDCWCKVNDDDFCWKCNRKAENLKTDFNLVMYIQQNDQEDEVIEIFSFHSILNLEIVDDKDITEENLNKMMMEKKCEAEYDVDKYLDDEKFKLVKFVMFSSKSEM